METNVKEDKENTPQPENEEDAATAEKDNEGSSKELLEKDKGPDSTAQDADEPASVSSSKETDAVESFTDFFKEKLGIGSDKFKKGGKIKILDEKSLAGIVKYINDKKVTKIVTLAGAGISTSAGIPDFRSPGTGLYDNLAKYNLPHPMAVFDIDFFQENPKPFFALAKELYPGSFKPTVSHYFVKLLNEKGLLLRHYTQNIDTLERVAGIPEEKIVEAHGTFHSSHCLECDREYELLWMKEIIFNDEIPKCLSCEGVVKPDIVFFGENLPSKFFKYMDKDFDDCEMLIVLGTSLVVQPFASLVDKVGDRVPRLLINRELAGEANAFMRAMGLSQGMDFSPSGFRDVAWLGDCDAGCKAMAAALGWEDELETMVETEHKQFEKEKEVESEKEKEVQREKEKEVQSEKEKEVLNEKKDDDAEVDPPK